MADRDVHAVSPRWIHTSCTPPHMGPYPYHNGMFCTNGIPNLKEWMHYLFLISYITSTILPIKPMIAFYCLMKQFILNYLLNVAFAKYIAHQFYHYMVYGLAIYSWMTGEWNKKSSSTSQNCNSTSPEWFHGGMKWLVCCGSQDCVMTGNEKENSE